MNKNNEEKYIHIDKEELYNLFIVQNKTRKYCAEYFNCSEATIKKKCRMYGIAKRSSKVVENTKKTLMDNYGSDKVWVISDKKRRETNIKKYGVEMPFQSSAIQDTIAKSRKNYYSKEEAIVRDILKNNNIEYEKEYIVSINDKNKYFDFCIYVNNRIILLEVDGIFHVKDIVGQERLERSIVEEQIKNEYCFNNNIELIRVPYFLTNQNKEKIILNAISPD